MYKESWLHLVLVSPVLGDRGGRDRQILKAHWLGRGTELRSFMFKKETLSKNRSRKLSEKDIQCGPLASTSTCIRAYMNLYMHDYTKRLDTTIFMCVCAHANKIPAGLTGLCLRIRTSFPVFKMALNINLTLCTIHLCEGIFSALSIKSKHQLTLYNIEDSLCPAVSNIPPPRFSFYVKINF